MSTLLKERRRTWLDEWKSQPVSSHGGVWTTFSMDAPKRTQSDKSKVFLGWIRKSLSHKNVVQRKTLRLVCTKPLAEAAAKKSIAALLLKLLSPSSKRPRWFHNRHNQSLCEQKGPHSQYTYTSSTGQKQGSKVWDAWNTTFGQLQWQWLQLIRSSAQRGSQWEPMQVEASQKIGKKTCSQYVHHIWRNCSVVS